MIANDRQAMMKDLEKICIQLGSEVFQFDHHIK